MLEVSRSFPASAAVSGQLPCPLPLSRVQGQLQAPGLPEPRAVWGLYLTTSRSCSDAVVLPVPGTDPRMGGCVPRALGERMDPRRALSPPRVVVSDLRSGASLSAARGPMCPEQPF